MPPDKFSKFSVWDLIVYQDDYWVIEAIHTHYMRVSHNTLWKRNFIWRDTPDICIHIKVNSMVRSFWWSLHYILKPWLKLEILNSFSQLILRLEDIYDIEVVSKSNWDSTPVAHPLNTKPITPMTNFIQQKKKDDFLNSKAKINKVEKISNELDASTKLVREARRSLEHIEDKMNYLVQQKESAINNSDIDTLENLILDIPEILNTLDTEILKSFVKDLVKTPSVKSKRDTESPREYFWLKD